MKRLLCLVCILAFGIAMMTSLLVVSADTVVSISTVEQLAAIRDDLDGHYKLTKNIKFSKSDFEKGGAFYNNGAGWLPIGDTPLAPFTGTFDGNGYTISGLYINIQTSSKDTSDKYVGLFGSVSGTVKDLCLDDVNITVDGAKTIRAGAVAGFSTGVIEQVSATGKITCKNGANTMAVGGIVGRQSHTASVNTCRTGINLLAEGKAVYVGGMVGQNMGGMISTSRAAGIVNGDATSRLFIGGIVGLNDNSSSTSGIVVNCLRDGETVGSAEIDLYGGGLIGQNKGRASSCVVLQEARFGCKRFMDAGQIAGENNGTLGLIYYINETETFGAIGSGTVAEAIRLESSFSKDDVSELLQDSDCWTYSGGTVKLKGLPSLPTTTKPATTTTNKVTTLPKTTTKKTTTTKRGGSSQTTTIADGVDITTTTSAVVSTTPTMPVDGDFVEDSDAFGTDDTIEEEQPSEENGWIVWVIIGGCAIVVLGLGLYLLFEIRNKRK